MHGEAPGRAVSPTDAPAQLVELRETEALGALDHHGGGGRHVHTHLDHRRGEQQPRLAAPEVVHRRGALRGGKLAVQRRALHAGGALGERHAPALAEPAERGLVGGVVRRADRGEDDVRLAALGQLLPQPRHRRLAASGGDHRRRHRAPARGQLVDHRQVEVAVGGQGERARDGRGAHHQQVGPVPLLLEQPALAHPEAVLLVDHHQRQVLERDALLQERLGPDHQLDLATPQGPSLPIGAAAAGEQQHRVMPSEQARERGVVLLGEELGGREQGALQAALGGEQEQERGHHRLAAPHVPLEEAAHGRRRGHLPHQLADGALLGRGEGEGKDLARPRPHRVVDAIAVGLGEAPLRRGASGEHPLLRQQLAVDQARVRGALPGGERGAVGVARRLVQEAHGLCQPRQAVPREELLRDRLAELALEVEPAHRLGDPGAQPHAADPRHLGIDRDDPLFGARRRRPLGVRQHELAAHDAEAPVQGHRTGTAQPVGQPGLAEPGHAHRAAAVAQRRLDEQAAPGAPRPHPLDLAAELHRRARSRVGDAREGPPVLVLARQVRQQVADRLQAGAGEGGRGARADAGEGA